MHWGKQRLSGQTPTRTHQPVPTSQPASAPTTPRNPQHLTVIPLGGIIVAVSLRPACPPGPPERPLPRRTQGRRHPAS